MLTAIRNLYVLGFVVGNVYMTRVIWMPPHRYDVFDLAVSALWGFAYAFFAPGIVLNMLLGGARSTPLILGGSFAFWLLLKQIGKSRRARQTPGKAGVMVDPAPGWEEGWSRKSTYYVEEE